MPGRSSAAGSGHSFPLDLGKKSPEIRGSIGRDWTQGQGTTLHHHQAAALPQRLIIPGQARPIQPFWRGRPETRRDLTWAHWGVCWLVRCTMYPPYLPLQSLRTTSLPLKYPWPHYNLQPDQGCCWTATPLLSCLLFIWALYAPALLPLIPSFYLFSVFVFLLSPGPSNHLLLARSPRPRLETSIRSLFNSRSSLEIDSHHGAPPRVSQRPVPSQSAIPELNPWHCSWNDPLPLVSASRCKPRACVWPPYSVAPP